jgi:thymidylate synthase ThyX
VTNYLPEMFTDQERSVLERYVTNLDGPVFCIHNVPQELAAALFARYSRSNKSLRRIFLDEFADDLSDAGAGSSLGDTSRTRALMGKVIGEYGDDSVAQLGVAHVAVEQVSTVLTRTMERHRLLSFLEQSTRYVNLASLRPDGSFRVVVPEELDGELGLHYQRIVAQEFALYASVYDIMFARFVEGLPQEDVASIRAARAAALDIARGCLPMATMTNVGIVGSAQALEYLVVRLRAIGSVESRLIADEIAREVAKVLGPLVARMDRPERGGRWTSYLAERGVGMEAVIDRLLPRALTEPPTPFAAPLVRLLEADPNGEQEVIAWMLYERSGLEFAACRRRAREFSEAQLSELFDAYVGDRDNRRHKPSRAWEMTAYTFEIETDYGSYRDLARHRLLTLLEQDPVHVGGYQVDERLIEEGLLERIDPVFGDAFRFADDVRDDLRASARMVLPMAARVRFALRLNARELLHMVELRSQPQGHPVYRKIAQEMYRLLESVGHHRIAASMQFVDLDDHILGRKAQEQRTIQKLQK